MKKKINRESIISQVNKPARRPITLSKGWKNDKPVPAIMEVVDLAEPSLPAQKSDRPHGDF